MVLGPDLYNGSAGNLFTFAFVTGTTYPLLLNGGSGPGNENLYVPYGDRDNYVVINKQGIIRYHAFDLHGLGSRYQLDEIRGCVDSLVSQGTVAVEDPSDPQRFLLSAAPNPFRGDVSIELSNPAEQSLSARVSVHDLAGRVVATLWNSDLARGVTRLSWDGRSDGGTRAAPGVYLVLAQVGGERLSQRIVRIE